MKNFARELKSASSSGSSSWSDHWTMQQDTFRDVAEDLSKVGENWGYWAETHDIMVAEPLKTLQATD
jgi:hypothetical protein